MASSFSIQAVAERTGLSTHVIRAWERRYRAIKPERSAGKHRLYSEAEIERLMVLHRAVRSGHSIGEIAHLPTDQLRSMGATQTFARLVRPAGSAINPGCDEAAASFRREALAAVQRFDEPALDNALRCALLALGHQGVLRLAIAPLAEEIGEFWRAGELTAAHEHFFTASVKLFLGGLARQSAPAANSPCIVIATPAGQLHELGALMAASAATNLGWRSIYLGPNLPAPEIAGAAVASHAVAVAISIVYPEDDPHLEGELISLANLLPKSTRILAGGRAASAYFETLIQVGALYGDSLEEFSNQLDALRRVPARK